MTMNSILKPWVLSAILTLAVTAPFTAPAFADEVVNVTLINKDGVLDLNLSLGLGLGMKGNMGMALTQIKIDRNTVSAGKVTFIVTNTSGEHPHEMIVAPVADDSALMPFNDKENRVDEDKSNSLGEVAELEPGKSGSISLDLKPGKYVLYCNVPGHFMTGMWTLLNVK